MTWIFCNSVDLKCHRPDFFFKLQWLFFKFTNNTLAKCCSCKILLNSLRDPVSWHWLKAHLLCMNWVKVFSPKGFWEFMKRGNHEASDRQVAGSVHWGEICASHWKMQSMDTLGVLLFIYVYVQVCMCVHVCVCLYVCLCVCFYVCLYIWLHVYVHMHVCMSV